MKPFRALNKAIGNEVSHASPQSAALTQTARGATARTRVSAAGVQQPTPVHQMTPEELRAYLRAQHEEERRTLFGNEAFAIGMLQSVALAASIALASQLGKIAALFGPMAASLMLSAFLLALALAVVAAFFRHQYKLFGAKAPLGKDDAEKASRNWWANFYLTGMRWLMGGATYLIACALVISVFALWLRQNIP